MQKFGGGKTLTKLDPLQRLPKLPAEQREGLELNLMTADINSTPSIDRLDEVILQLPNLEDSNEKERPLRIGLNLYQMEEE